MAGGKFGHGFVSAGLGAALGGKGGIIGAAVVGGTIAEISGGKFKNGAASAAFSYAMSWGVEKYRAGGQSHDRSTDGELGPKRFTEEQKTKYRSEIEAALATQPNNGFEDDVAAMEWFKENMFPIANQGDVPKMDFEIYASLSPLVSLGGRYMFVHAGTDFYNHMVRGGGNVHTHQTSAFFSPDDKGINMRRDRDRYLVNDADMYKFRGKDYWKDLRSWRNTGSHGQSPMPGQYYQIYSKGAGWLDM